MKKFLVCKHCGNLIIGNNDILICCGAEMSELVPNTVDSARKHLPIVSVLGDTIGVTVGSDPHPMEEDHSIIFIYVETKHGGQRKCFNIGDEPKLVFNFSNDIPIAVYAYCNLHGLWKTEL